MKRVLCLALAFLMIGTLVPINPLIADAATALEVTPNPQVEYDYTTETPVGTIRYIAQNKSSDFFNSNYWPSNSFGGYVTSEKECGTACISMALSYVGINRTPKDLLEAEGVNGYTGLMWGQQGDATSTAITKSQEAISVAMDNYINGDGKYSPVCVYIKPFSAASKEHWVLLVGKIDENKYLAINPWNEPGTGITLTVQINGETATYNGLTNPIVSVNQWYNPNATPPIIRNAYPSYCTVNISAKTYVKSLPCSRDTNPNSEDVEGGAAKKGSTYQAIGLVENTAGNFWYKVLTKDGETGYIYSGDVTVVSHDFGEVTISGVTAPASIVEGDKFSIHGLVFSNNLPLWQVGAYVYSGASPNAKLHLKSEDISVGKNSYELYNSAVDYGLTFNQLKTGTYTYEIAVVLFSYTANGKTLNSPNNKAFYLYRDSFSVTKNPANCSHSYNNVGVCTECGTAYDFGVSFDASCAGLYKVSLAEGIQLRTDVPYSASSAKAELIPAGTTVQVLGSVTNHYQKKWYKISYNGTVGYMYFSHLTLVPHDCDKGTYMFYEEAHPHRNCYKCSLCGKIWADNDSKNFVSACLSCAKITNLPTDVFLSQQTAVTCTLSAAAMMLRSRMYLNENPRWAEVTESVIRSTAWVEGVGLKFSFNYSVGNTNLSVGHEFVSGLSISSLKDLLDSHPEGVVVYCGYAPHAVFVFDYEGDTFYCADPAGSYSGKRIKLADSLLGYYYGDQSTILGNVTAYWYISAVAVDGVVVPGKPVLNYSISNNTVTFTWNGTFNTTHYNLWLEKKNAAGEWESVEQIFYAENGLSRELGDGEYRAQLLSYNSNAYESDGSDWVHTWADDVFFSIDTEKKVTYYGADGNVWLEDGFASGENYVLATQYPTSSNGYFSGWAYASNATEWDVQPGDTINCTEDVSLHPVYVSHTDAISGNAVQIYNIADFTQSGYNIETVQVTVQREETVGSWSAWSDYTTDEITPSDSVQVETTTLYRYYYFYCSNCGGREPFWGTSDCGAQIPNTAWHIGWFTTPFSQCNHKTYSYTSAKYYTTSLGDDQIWNFSSGNLNDTAVGTKDSGGTEVVITTGYRSRTYVEQSETVEKTVTAYKITKTANTNTRYEVLYYPSKTDYWVGDPVDLTRFALKATYEDGSTAVITDGFTVAGFDSDTIGTKTILITYDSFTVAFDITVSYGGVCGENVMWNLDEQGTLTIFGEGDMYNDIGGQMPWNSYCSAIKKVVVQNGITNIGENAFRSCVNLNSVTLSNSITEIGAAAFAGCTGLTSIILPNSVTTIGHDAFLHCTGLTSVVIPDSVTDIGWYAFSGCTELISITIPDGIASIGHQAFKGCDNLSFNIYDNGKYLGNSNNPYMVLVDTTSNDITSCQIHPNTKMIGDIAFTVCTKLTSITIPGSVTTISSSAFYGCTSLTSVIIQDGVENIETDAFEGCTELNCVTIPDSVTYIGWMAFRYCDSLETVVYCGTQAQWDAVEKANSCDDDLLGKAVLQFHNYENGVCTICQYQDSVLTFMLNENGDGYVVSDCNQSASGKLVIPATYNGLPVTGVGETAFYQCASLTEVVIPDSVTRIDWGAFQDCSGLSSITIPDSVTYIGVGAFARCTSLIDINLPDGLTTLNDSMFAGCIGLTSIAIPDEVTLLGLSVFTDCTNLTEVNLGKGVQRILASAFFGCKKLTTIAIPVSVTSIEDEAFDGCDSLSTVIYCGTIKQWEAIEKDDRNDPLHKATIQLHNYENGVCSICNQGTSVLGDANGDGKVNLRDAIQVLQASNGKDIAIDRSAADVTGDGKVNLQDAIRILKRANGNKDPFPAEK